MTHDHWKGIGKEPHHGLNVALSSLYSRPHQPYGEFFDLLPLIDFCTLVGFDILQLLPLCDTGWDSSPYSALSASALHPIYLSLEALPERDPSHPAFKALASPALPYFKILQYKEAFLRSYHAKKGPCPPSFLKEHPWAPLYARFKALQTLNQFKKWNQWTLFEPDPDEIDYHLFVQFLCFQQMEHVKNHATKKGILLKGDVPLLMSLESADVYNHPDLFDTHFSIGAPPDEFNPHGQNWRAPYFRWEKVSDSPNDWWKQRLKAAEKLYHLYRIDHVIGLFHTWSIPQGKTAAQGEYLPKKRSTWIPQGRKLLHHFLDFTTMLPIAEDLGVVPDGLRPLLARMQIPCTKVLRWEEEDPKHFPKCSMTTLSTHDMEPLRLWWKLRTKEAKKAAHKRGWKYQPELTSEQHFSFLEESHRSRSYFHINMLHDYLTLFPSLRYQDPLQERINWPGTICTKNWSTHMPISIETLFHSQELIQCLKQLSS